MKGPRAAANPWDATGLEWSTPSPPPKENFLRPVVVTAEPYRYHPPGFAPHEAEGTFEPQGRASGG